MNNFLLGLMSHRIGCPVKYCVIQHLKNRISTSCPISANDGTKSRLFVRLKNSFGLSSGFNRKQIQRIPKNIFISTRGMADYESKNREPSIHDSSEQKQKNNDNSEKHEKKCVVKVDWGVKLSDEQVECAENVEDHFPKYILKQKWGVNLLEPMRLEQRRVTNKNVISRFDDVMQSDKKNTRSLQKTEMKVMNESASSSSDSSSHSSILPSTPEQDESLKSLREQELKYQVDKNWSNNSEMLLNSKNSHSKDDDEQDVLTEINCEDEIIAWQNVIVRTREHIKKSTEVEQVKLREIKHEEVEIKFSILPEPPRPKLDIAAVKSTELYNLIDSYIDPTQPPTAKGIRIALYQVNGNKNSTSPFDQNREKSAQQTIKQTHHTK